MADRPIAEALPADLPEDWTEGQIIAPAGADVGLSEQHGYNYLMEMVNRAQQGVNAINEGFDSISGKRTCRVVVGTSTAGWTEADCDLLCDGTDDQVEIQAALESLPENGGEIAILDGTYNISKAITVDLDTTSGAKNIVLFGNGPSTVLTGGDEIRIGFVRYMTDIESDFGSIDLRDLSFKDLDISVQYLKGFVSGCRFQNTSMRFYYLSDSNAEIRRNYYYNESKESIVITANSGVCFITNNYIVTGHMSPISTMATTQAVSENIIIGSESHISFSGNGSIENNRFIGCNLDISGDECTVSGNYIQGGGISWHKMSDSPSGSPSHIVGNAIKDGSIHVTDWAAILSNTITASEGKPCITAKRQTIRSLESLSPIIIGNCFSGGTFGVHLLLEDYLPIGSRDKKNAFITGNRFLGQTSASVQIESTWQDCMITNNIIDTPVVDNGTNNIVRFNSDDSGGGGGGTAGVSSFKGRTGTVYPQAGDYTADQVGAIPTGDVAAIQSLTQAQYDALAEKDPATLYLIQG